MQVSELRLIEKWEEFLPEARIDDLPRGLRGIYVLYRYRRKSDCFNVVYVGMTSKGRLGGIRSRLRRHKKKKHGLWTHCSVFKVHDNIQDEEVAELEGLLRQIYGRDAKASILSKLRSFKKLKKVKPILPQN